MAKRIADKELTDRNWDQEDEGEEAGTFSVASDDVLKGRAIKKAKRRNTGGESEGGGAFRGFKGFALTTAAATPPTFSGFGSPGGFKGFSGLTNGTSSALSFGGFSSPAASTAAAGLTFNGPSSSSSSSSSSTPSTDSAPLQSNGSAPSPPQSHREYRRQLTALNCSVRDWISKHVNDNPLCDLNPIFRDYERHLASIERQHGAGSADRVFEEKKTPAAAPSSSSGGSSAPSAALFSFSKKPGEDSAQRSSGVAATPAVTFNFGEKVDRSVLCSLGSKPSSFTSSTLFGGPASTPPLSLSGSKAEVVQPAEENGDEESEEPPKPEVKEVKEDDAFYSKKCKLFYKKEAEFKEKGVGTLHLKHTADGKIQMVVRADTNLGNILLNIIVPPSMPCTRVGKNNVMVVCIPNPPIDKNPGSPIPLLIRVKTSEDADELHRTLEQKKG